jgi:hypothetical protein
MDEHAELIRDVDRLLTWASKLSQMGVDGNFYDGYRRAIPARSEAAVNSLLTLLERAKVVKGVRW